MLLVLQSVPEDTHIQTDSKFSFMCQISDELRGHALEKLFIFFYQKFYLCINEKIIEQLFSSH